MKQSYVKNMLCHGFRAHTESADNPQVQTLLLEATNGFSRLLRCALALILTLWITTASGPARATEPTAEVFVSAKSLDEQVQEIKSDVLGIAAELSNLEERLLYPSNTQLAVFVSLSDGQPVEIDSARISIDGKLVSQHIYSFKELEALEKGGVQRIYTGNVQTGEHRLEVSISGKRGAEKDFETVESFVFNKEVAPKLVGITLTGESMGSATIAITDW
jgi:hypothetical protein